MAVESGGWRHRQSSSFRPPQSVFCIGVSTPANTVHNHSAGHFTRLLGALVASKCTVSLISSKMRASDSLEGDRCRGAAWW
jgi:hypothetical protein